MCVRARMFFIEKGGGLVGRPVSSPPPARVPPHPLHPDCPMPSHMSTLPSQVWQNWTPEMDKAEEEEESEAAPAAASGAARQQEVMEVCVCVRVGHVRVCVWGGSLCVRTHSHSFVAPMTRGLSLLI